MAKNANNAPAANSNDQQAPLGFLAQLSTLATAITDLSTVATKRDPLVNARTKFSANCDETIKLIKAAAENAKFFRKLPDNGYLVTFRNGNSAMQLNGAAHFKVADAQAAIALVEAAKTAAAAGELDEAFRESTRGPRKAKAEAPAPHKYS
jgi:hypothetical protein